MSLLDKSSKLKKMSAASLELALFYQTQKTLRTQILKIPQKIQTRRVERKRKAQDQNPSI
jgi:hypothetical protein